MRKEVKGMVMKRRRMHMEKKRRVKAKRRENGESVYVSGTLKAKGVLDGQEDALLNLENFFWLPIFAYSMFSF